MPFARLADRYIPEQFQFRQKVTRWYTTKKPNRLAPSPDIPPARIARFATSLFQGITLNGRPDTMKLTFRPLRQPVPKTATKPEQNARFAMQCFLAWKQFPQRDIPSVIGLPLKAAEKKEPARFAVTQSQRERKVANIMLLPILPLRPLARLPVLPKAHIAQFAEL